MKSLERLRNDAAVFGLMQTYPMPAVSELIAWCGFDFVVLDCEHGAADESAQLDALRALEGGGTFSIVRLRDQDAGAVARYLDFGAQGVMVPDVRTPDQARRVSFAALKRWTGGLRGDRYGLVPSTTSAPRPLVIVLIEHPDGVANIDTIVAEEGIGGVMIGSGDLSSALGAPGDFKSPAYLAAVEHVECVARAHGKILGIKPENEASIPVLYGRGYRFFLIGRDMPLFKRALMETLQRASTQVPQS